MYTMLHDMFSYFLSSLLTFFLGGGFVGEEGKRWRCAWVTLAQAPTPHTRKGQDLFGELLHAVGLDDDVTLKKRFFWMTAWWWNMTKLSFLRPSLSLLEAGQRDFCFLVLMKILQKPTFVFQSPPVTAGKDHSFQFGTANYCKTS